MNLYSPWVLETVVTVVLRYSLFLRSWVMHHDCLRGPMSPLLFLHRFFSYSLLFLSFSLNPLILFYKQFKLLACLVTILSFAPQISPNTGSPGRLHSYSS